MAILFRRSSQSQRKIKSLVLQYAFLAVTGLSVTAARAGSDDGSAPNAFYLLQPGVDRAAQGQLYVHKRQLQSDLDGKHYEGIVAETTALIQIDPSDPMMYFIRGTAQVALKECDRAIQDLLKYTKMRPEDAMGFYNLGTAYLGNRDYEHAAPCFERAANLKPDFYDAFSQAANAYKKLADRDRPDSAKSTTEYDKSIALYDRASRMQTVSSKQRADMLYNEAAALEAKAQALDTVDPLKIAVIVWGKWELLSPIDPDLPKIKKHVTDMLDKIDRES